MFSVFRGISDACHFLLRCARLGRVTIGKSTLCSVRDNSSVLISQYDSAVPLRNEPCIELSLDGQASNAHTNDQWCVVPLFVGGCVSHHSLLPRQSMTYLYTIEFDSMSFHIAVLTCPLGYCAQQFPATLWPSNFRSSSIVMWTVLFTTQQILLQLAFLFGENVGCVIRIIVTRAPRWFVKYYSRSLGIMELMSRLFLERWKYLS